MRFRLMLATALRAASTSVALSQTTPPTTPPTTQPRTEMPRTERGVLAEANPIERPPALMHISGAGLNCDYPAPT